ncbi:MAG: glycosyltransferase family 39 protein [Candidatus Kaiserbacteria bacterium]|nr:MAG: glycosyltransferase family 39 protein [Candidatus Kaiserbacteria bacterium]
MPARLSPLLPWIAAILLIATLAAFLKLSLFGTTVSSDYQEYLATAQAFAGEPGFEVAHNRILKPLAPALVALLGQGIGYHEAMLAQALFFYLALALATFFFAREYFQDERLAFLLTLMSALSYPVLKYGVDVLTETGAWFFFVLSLWLTVRFLREPRPGLFLLNALVVAVGFLWKEYSIVGGAILGLATLFHPALSLKQKTLYALGGSALFLLIHAPWQWYVYVTYGFTYLTWYGQNAGPGFAMEFTLKNVIKSTAAILGLAWLLVPRGLRHFSTLDTWRRRFLQVAALPPLVGYLWGYISSRLLYVIAPPALLLAGLGLRTLPPRVQIAVTAFVVLANIAWLSLSYSITL